jgi:hypothetical protein
LMKSIKKTVNNRGTDTDAIRTYKYSGVMTVAV